MKSNTLKQLFHLDSYEYASVMFSSCLAPDVLVSREPHLLTNLLEGGLKKGEVGLQPLLLPCDAEISSENFSAASHQFCLLFSAKASDPMAVWQPATRLPLKPRFAINAFS